MNRPLRCSQHLAGYMFAERPRKLKILNAWFKLWNMDADLWWFGHKYLVILHGPGSSVGVASELRAGRSGMEPRWGRDPPTVQTGPGAHPASCKMGTGSFPGVKCGRGVLLTTHPLLVPRSLWSVLESRVRSKFPPPSPLKQLADVLHEKRHNFPLQTIQNLI